MIAAVVVLVLANIVLSLALVVSMTSHRNESDRWAIERRELVNRVIARHTGEVLALDRDQQPKTEREHKPPVLIEGMN